MIFPRLYLIPPSQTTLVLNRVTCTIHWYPHRDLSLPLYSSSLSTWSTSLPVTRISLVHRSILRLEILPQTRVGEWILDWTVRCDKGLCCWIKTPRETDGGLDTRSSPSYRRSGPPAPSHLARLWNFGLVRRVRSRKSRSRNCTSH